MTLGTRRRSPEAGELYGDTAPRVSSSPELASSKGSEAVRFARDRLGVDPLPWQELALERGLVHDGERWCSRTVGILVGRQNGKTLLAAIRALVGMCVFGERSILAAAQNRDVALDAWRFALELAEDAGLPVHDVRRTNGQEIFWIDRARYKVVANTRAAGRGLAADLVILDELREYRDFDGYAALEKTRRAQWSSQVWAISNEGDDGSVVLEHLAAQGRLAAETGTAGDLAWLEWSAAPDLERTDPRAWQQSNPALGYLISPETIASESVYDEPHVFETEVLCRRVASLRPWLPQGTWDACGDQGASVPDGSEVVFALDAGPELRHATIAVGWKRPDGRVFLEAIAGYGSDDGPVLPRAAERLLELVERWSAAGVIVVGRSGAEAAAERILEGLEIPIVSFGSAELVRAVNAFHESVIARELVHSGDKMSAMHLAAITSDGILRRRSSSADIDAGVALVLARHGALHAPARVETQDWIAF